MSTNKSIAAAAAFALLFVLSNCVVAVEKDCTAAVRQAVAFLQQSQQADGHWPDLTGFPDGVTALATLALLESGIPAGDDHVQRALKRLRQADSDRTYTTALTMMVFAAADPQGNRPLVERGLQRLEANQHKSGDISGAWGYGQPRGVVDNSNTRFALLGLQAAERAGVRADPQTWRRTLDYWLKNQNNDGSWGYGPGLFGTGSMTCSGIASVVMAGGRYADDQQLSQRVRQAADRGLVWLGEHYTVHKNPSLTGVELPWLFYYLNTLESAGRLTNRATIGNHDWFREGSALVLNRQDPQTGAWSVKENPDEGNTLIATSLALLFLSGHSAPQPPPPNPAGR